MSFWAAARGLSCTTRLSVSASVTVNRGRVLQEYDFLGGCEVTLFHDEMRVTLTVAYRAGDNGAMLFHQTGWDPVPHTLSPVSC